jgi:ethanolaminephosphotransferase
MLETLGITKAAWVPDGVYDFSWTDWFIGYGGVILVLNTVWR